MLKKEDPNTLAPKTPKHTKRSPLSHAHHNLLHCQTTHATSTPSYIRRRQQPHKQHTHNRHNRILLLLLSLCTNNNNMTDHNATEPPAIRHLAPTVAVRLVELTRPISDSDEETSRQHNTRTPSSRPTNNNHPTASSRPSRATNTDDDPQAERLRRLTGTIAGTIFQDLIAGSFRPVDPGPPPASDAAIAALERDPPARDPSERCPICLEALCSGSPPTSPKACESAHACTGRAGDPIDLDLPPTRVRMPCGHDFHEGCLLQWVRTHRTCPVCRYELERGEPKDEGHPNPLLATIQGWREAVAAEGAQRAAAANAAEGGADAATVADGGSGPSLALPAGLEHLGIPRTAFAITARRAPDGTFSFPQMASFTVEFPPLHLLSARGAPPLGGGRGGYGAPPRALLRRLGVAVPPSDDDSPPASPPAERAAAAAEAQLRALSVPELKRRLGELGVDNDGIIEKRELVNLLLRHSARPERRGSSSGAAGSTRAPPGHRNARRSREAAIGPLLRQAAASSTRRGRSASAIESADRELDSRARRDIDDNTRDGPRSRLSNAAASLSQAAVWLLERAEASRARAEALFQSAIAPESPQGGSSQVARSSPVGSEAMPLAPLPPPEARPTALRSPAASSSRLRDRASRSSNAVGTSQDEQPGPSSGARPKRRRLNH